MAFTDHMRSVAYEMFENDATSAQVARRTRQPIGSVRALRANWTRNLPKTRKRPLKAATATTRSR